MTDIMARIARNEPMTAHEQTMYGTVLNLCTDGPNFDGFFVLIEAVNRKATLRGLILGLNLRRPKRPKAVRRPIRELNGALKALWPGTDERSEGEGPIERELRDAVSSGASLRAEAYVFYHGAKGELQRRDDMDPDDIDIMSEAIEAAAALGL